MKQMSKDDMILLYVNTVDIIIKTGWDMNDMKIAFRYHRLIAKKELLEKILGIKTSKQKIKDYNAK